MRFALSMRVVRAREYEETRDAVSHDWRRWLERGGHQFFPVPNGLADLRGHLDCLPVDGVILTGGNDLVAPAGSESDVAPERTATEHELIAAAIERGLPVFAVCRGLHVVNAFFGGATVADLAATCGRPSPHVGRDHAVALAPPFDAVAGCGELRTNSFHNQGVVPSGLAPDLVAFGRSPSDGVIEGAVHRTRPILAVQWHPERPNPAAAFDDLVFARLFTEGAFWG